jgi:hypothetical protein
LLPLLQGGRLLLPLQQGGVQQGGRVLLPVPAYTFAGWSKSSLTKIIFDRLVNIHTCMPAYTFGQR